MYARVWRCSWQAAMSGATGPYIGLSKQRGVRFLQVTGKFEGGGVVGVVFYQFDGGVVGEVLSINFCNLT